MSHEKYNGKPMVFGPVPWYRHHIFPWGVYQIGKLPLNVGDVINSDGYHSVGDGGDCTYEIVDAGTAIPNGGTFIDLPKIQAKAIFSEGAYTKQFGESK